MDNIKAYLVEWSIVYIRNRDVIEKKLIEIIEKKDGFDIIAKYRDNNKFFLSIPFLNKIEDLKPAFDKDKFVMIVSFNTKENIKLLIDNWKQLTDYPKLSFVFVNPFSMNDKKWLIYPWTHNRIADPDSLKTGIKSMADGIGLVNKSQIEKAII